MFTSGVRVSVKCNINKIPSQTGEMSKYPGVVGALASAVTQSTLQRYVRNFVFVFSQHFQNLYNHARVQILLLPC